MTTMPQWTMESFIALSKAFQAALTMQGAFEFEAAQNPPEVWYAVAVMLSERIDPITGKERGQEVPLSLPYFDSEALIQSEKQHVSTDFKVLKKYAFPIVQSNRNSEG